MPILCIYACVSFGACRLSCAGCVINLWTFCCQVKILWRRWLATHWHTHAHPHPPTRLISPTQLVACGAVSNMARRGHQATLPRGSRLDSHACYTRASMTATSTHPHASCAWAHDEWRGARTTTNRPAHHHEPLCSPPQPPCSPPQRDPQCWNASFSVSIR
jgi:hypothetical protein